MHVICNLYSYVYYFGMQSSNSPAFVTLLDRNMYHSKFVFTVYIVNIIHSYTHKYDTYQHVTSALFIHSVQH